MRATGSFAFFVLRELRDASLLRDPNPLQFFLKRLGQRALRDLFEMQRLAGGFKDGVRSVKVGHRV